MPEKISIGLVSRTFFNVPLWAAMEHGVFAADGIEVVPTLLGSASQVPPLLDGSLQVVIGSPESAMQNAAAGGPLRLIAGNAGKLVHSLIARAPFKRIEDLRGGTIGILNMKEGTFFHIKTMLAAHGLNFPGDYKVTETGGVPPRHKALLEGAIDAGLQSVPWNFVAEDAGMNNLGNVIDHVPDWQFVSINANAEWAAANRDLLVRFLRTLLRATEWLYANRAAASEIAAREMPAPIGHAQRAWDHFTGTNALTRDMSVNIKGLAHVIATLRQSGHLPEGSPTDPGFYIDGRYLDAARSQATN
jgi:ABC-type nitrate/sulfonate/bicarbonate transport system substrate-binding protein